MRFFTLASSSSGNAAFLGDSQGGLLVDCGISARKVTTGLKEKGVTPADLEGVLLTHEHTDHIKGLAVFLKNKNLPVCGDMDLLRRLRGQGMLPADIPLVPLLPEKAARVGRFDVTAIATSHDALCPLGFRVGLGNSLAGVLTDTGCITPQMAAALCGVQMILLESNYEPGMLAAGRYPYALKKRIASEMGHLSNQQAGELAAWLLQNGTTRFVLGHLSKENNMPLLAAQTTEKALQGVGAVAGRDYILQVAPPDTPMETLLF